MSFDLVCEDEAGTIGLLGAGAGALLGLIIGVAAGSASSSDTWTPVDGSIQVTGTATRGAPGVAMRVEF